MNASRIRFDAAIGHARVTTDLPSFLFMRESRLSWPLCAAAYEKHTQTHARVFFEIDNQTYMPLILQTNLLTGTKILFNSLTKLTTNYGKKRGMGNVNFSMSYRVQRKNYLQFGSLSFLLFLSHSIDEIQLHNIPLIYFEMKNFCRTKLMV